jgi:hypothetical protein
MEAKMVSPSVSSLPDFGSRFVDYCLKFLGEIFPDALYIKVRILGPKNYRQKFSVFVVYSNITERDGLPNL